LSFQYECGDIKFEQKNSMTETIKLSEALSQLDEKVLPDGSQKTFSIKFIKKDGEVVYFNRAVSPA